MGLFLAPFRLLVHVIVVLIVLGVLGFVAYKVAGPRQVTVTVASVTSHCPNSHDLTNCYFEITGSDGTTFRDSANALISANTPDLIKQIVPQSYPYKVGHTYVVGVLGINLNPGFLQWNQQISKDPVQEIASTRATKSSGTFWTAWSN